MNANEKFIAANAHVDEAAIQPLPNSRKIYVEGSRPDIRVPMREISPRPTRRPPSRRQPAGEITPEFVRDESRPRPRHHPGNINHPKASR
jgi:hypothetical protein